VALCIRNSRLVWLKRNGDTALGSTYERMVDLPPSRIYTETGGRSRSLSPKRAQVRLNTTP
jgi:hypothetical protein